MTSTPDRQRLLERFERLIAFNSENPPGREIEAIQYLAEIFRTMGLQVEVDEFALGRANIVARLENGPGPIFAFNSHVDVVPAGGGWLQIRSSSSAATAIFMRAAPATRRAKSPAWWRRSSFWRARVSAGPAR